MERILTPLLLLLLPGLLLAQTTAISPARPVAFTHVTVIDVTGAPPKSDMTVIVAGNHIAAVGRTGRVRIPGDAQVVDARGKFLIPGLWDMHAHTFFEDGPEWIFPLLVAHGVTGVRDLGRRVPFERINQIRREVSGGTLLGPRYGAVTSGILDGEGSVTVPNWGIAVETTDEARRLVREYKQQGMDFIKTYNLLSRELYLAIVDEAKRQKIAVAGHIPFSMTAAEVSDLGQISIEHFYDIFLSCSRDEAQLRQESAKWLESAKAGQVRPIRGQPPIQGRAVATYDERKARTLVERLARNGTWICPTIGISYVHPSERTREGDSRLKYIPAQTQERWRNEAKQRPAGLLTAEERTMRDHRKLEIVGLMHRAGVGMLAGSDAPYTWVFPGLSLHEELELFVRAGLSPLAALQTATVNPAKFLGKEKELGTIEKGKLADLVLLEANPLENISNTRRINAVVVSGRYLPKEALQKLLAEVEAAVNRAKSR